MYTPSQNAVQLAERAAAGERFEFLFFFGHRQRSRGRLDSSCLSQWYPLPFEVDGVTYPTAEHWMMAEKARLFGDEEARRQILASDDPGRAKALGRKVRGFDTKRWNAHRCDVVHAGNVAKFSAHEHASRYLMNTGRRVLVEASARDGIWGIGLAESQRSASNPTKWRGLNLLGFILMDVRRQLGGA
ncbi:MAG: NADAR family protein [Myxococcota bacterium]